MNALMITLRLLHVLGGVLWVGMMFFATFFMMPAIVEAGPDGAKVMAGVMRRRLPQIMPVIALVTILSGAWLYYRDSAGFQPAFLHSRMGMALGTGGILAIVAFFIGVAVIRPNMMRAVALTQEAMQAPAAERESKMAQAAAARARGHTAEHVVAFLLILAVAAMAVGRYI